MENWRQLEDEAVRSTLARQEYARYLESLSWDFFITVTFRRHWRDGIRACDRTWEVLNGKHFFYDQEDPVVSRAFLASEMHRRPNLNCHVHGLVKARRFPFGSNGSSIISPNALWDTLFRRFGRSRVEEIREVSDVSIYTSKYVVKRLSEYGFYGNREFWQC